MYAYELLHSTDNDNLETNKDKVESIKQKTKSNFHTYTYNLSKKINGKKHSKKMSIQYYSSGPSGTRIINAISGTKTDFIVGSNKENLFFKVIMSTGTHEGGSVTLFYNSPEEFEKHQNCFANPESKEKWYDKKMQFLQEKSKK